MNPKTILITGASGLIGTRLTKMLEQNGHHVRHLSRTKKDNSVSSFTWDIEKKHIDKGVFDSVDAVIHLTGAGIADKPWTAKRKQQILESRTNSTALLFDTLKATQHTVHTFISASAIGYYGFGDGIFSEDSEPGNDFLADVVRRWEAQADKIQSLSIRTVKIRTGIVLSKDGGALKEITKPVRFGVGAVLGTGKQHMSWIHIDDLSQMFMYALMNDKINGAYNAVSPTWTTNEELTKGIARVLKKPLWLPPVPGFVLKILLGEMADLVLKGSKISSDKIQQAGFKFKFPLLEGALENLLGNPQT